MNKNDKHSEKQTNDQKAIIYKKMEQNET